MPRQPRQPFQGTPAVFRQRITIVAIALVAAQIMYAVLAMAMLQNGFKAPANPQQKAPVTTGLFLFGMCSVIASFPIVGFVARRNPVQGGFAISAPILQRQFFVGFAISEIASLAGLFIFFSFADFRTLVFLIVIAATAILIHFLRVKKIVESFEQASRRSTGP